MLLWGVFSQGVATDLPVAVVDQDASAASRQFVRWLDATAGLRVALRPANVEDAWTALRRGDVHGVVLVPRDFARDLKRGRRGEIQAWYNEQFLPVANAVQREMQTAAAGFDAALETKGRLARGEPRAAVALRLNPIGAQRTTLFNPQLSYGPFLVAGLAATILHMAAMLAAVRAVGRELRDGTAPAWLASAGGRLVPALAGKLAVPFAVHATLGLGTLIVWHSVLGWPLRGSGALLTGGLLALLAAYYALGLLVVGVSANYRLASSVAAFLTAPALAFGGITFPLESMPWPARWWGRLLPLTSYLQLQAEQTARGATVAASLPQFLVLAGVAAVGGFAGAWLIRHRARQPECWGRR